MMRTFVGYIETKLVLAAVVVACLCGATLHGIYRHAAAAHADMEELLAGNLRSRHLVQTMSIVQDAETGQRGYLLTGRDTYLTPYLAALGSIEVSLATLQADYAGTDLATSVVAEIDRGARAKFAELKQTVELHRTRGFEAARQIILQDTGKQLMDTIRTDVGRLIEAERAAIDRIAHRQSSSAMRDADLWFGAALAGLLPISLCLVLAFRDARRNRHEGARLAHASSHDALTGVLSRPAFLARLDAALSRRPRAVGVLFIDLNGFKAINDDLGHAVGDRVLVEVARRLQEAVRPDDTVARLGGDEFVLFVEPCTNPQALPSVAGRIEAALSAIRLPDLDRHRIGGSVGTAHSSDGTPSAAALIKAADAAMYERKSELRKSELRKSELRKSELRQAGAAPKRLRFIPSR